MSTLYVMIVAFIISISSNIFAETAFEMAQSAKPTTQKERDDACVAIIQKYLGEVKDAAGRFNTELKGSPKPTRERSRSITQAIGTMKSDVRILLEEAKEAGFIESDAKKTISALEQFLGNSAVWGSEAAKN